jgi:predicted TIM-barrel fold metal-dependent hydrolase
MTMSAETAPPLSAPPDPNPRRPNFAIPPAACDCHAHVFGPGNRYPFIPHGLYVPADALPAQYRHMLDVLGVERGVLVQPSIYGTDNRAMLDALAQDPARLRGVAVLPFDADRNEIERLHAQGVRGVRCNIVDLKFDKGKLPLDGLRALAANIKPYGWHLEFLMHVDEFPELDLALADFPVEVVFGHLGYVPTAHGTETKGFAALLRLLRDGKAWVKLTAPYRLTPGAAPYPDVTPFAQQLVEGAPERLLWGSDWPHTFIKSAMPNDGDLFGLFAQWVPDEGMRRRILVHNPARLYDY